MERIGALIKKQQAGANLQKWSAALLTLDPEGNTSLSIYKGELKPEVVAKNMARVKAAFPSLQKEFYLVLIERLKEKGFTDERLIDAVNNVIDNCQYPTPTMANFLSFDKRVKIYCYSEYVNAITNKGMSGNSFAKIKINEKNFFVLQSDKVQYNLPEEL